MGKYLPLLSVVATMAAQDGLQGQRIYSYVNEQGVRIFSNIGSRRADPSRRPPTERVDSSGNLIPIINDIAGVHGVDSQLVHAIIKVESDFDPLAVSRKDCKGLMQLHPDTARRFGVIDIFDPRQNIEGGVRYLTWLMDEFDSDLDRVLAAYNAGEHAVRKYNGIPPYPETVDYIRKVRKQFNARAPANRAKVIQRRSSPVRRVLLEDGSVLYTNLGNNSN